MYSFSALNVVAYFLRWSPRMYLSFVSSVVFKVMQRNLLIYTCHHCLLKRRMNPIKPLGNSMFMYIMYLYLCDVIICNDIIILAVTTLIQIIPYNYYVNLYCS